jgi:hypothetical protein
MSLTNEKDVDNLLKNWYEAKQTIASLEKKCDKYKKLAEKIMLNMNTNNLSSSSYLLSRRNLVRNTISKKDMPIEVWKKYATENKYDAYYIKEKK